MVGFANELLAAAQQVERDEASRTMRAASESRLADGDPALRDHPLWADLAREHYRSRRTRDKVFGTETLFGEPAWDILLDLFIAAKENRRVSVMSACIGAAVPSTTALRWITALEREGLLVREDDPLDARRTYVMLSPRGYGAMVEYFVATSRTIRTTALAEPAGLPPAAQSAPLRTCAARAPDGQPRAPERLPTLQQGRR